MEKTFTKKFIKNDGEQVRAEIAHRARIVGKDPVLAAPFKPKTVGKVTPQLMKAVVQSEKRATEAELAQLINEREGRAEEIVPMAGIAGQFPESTGLTKEELAAKFDKEFPDLSGYLHPLPAPAPYVEPYRPAVWLSSAAAARHINSSVVKLGKLRTLGEGPKCYKQPDGTILYEQYDLDRWVRSMPTIGSEY